MISSYIVRAANTITTAGTRYIPLCSDLNVGQLTTVAGVQQPMSMAGTLQNFGVQLSAALGAGLSITYVIMKNGIADSPTVTISGASQTAAIDTTHTTTFAQGDLLCIQYTTSGTIAATNQALSFEINATGQALLTGDSAALSNSASRYIGIQNADVLTTVPPNSGSEIPTAGTISNAFVKMNLAPGGTASYNATLVLNGVDTALVVTVSGASDNGSDTTHTVNVSAGDFAYWRYDPAGTPASRSAQLGAQFIPTIDGESIQTGYSSSNLSTAANQMATPVMAGAVGYATLAAETTRSAIINSVAVYKKLYVTLSADPTPGNRAFFIRDAGADTAVTVAIAAGSTSGNDTTHTATSAVGDYVNLHETAASTPTAGMASWGFVTYIAPATTASGSTLLLMGVG
jgi:hypothetical protein